MPAFDGSQTYITQIMTIRSIANLEVEHPNKECVQENKDEPWKCYYAQYLMKHISVPLFIVQSLYDSQAIIKVLKIDCAKDFTLSKCT